MAAACRKLYAAIDQLDHRAASRVGITLSELRALNLLESGPVRAGHLARSLGLTSGAISTMIDRLERRGLVTRVPDEHDRRAVLVAPTEAMFRQLAPLYQRVASDVGKIADGYDAQQLAAALETLESITRAYAAAAQAE